ELTRHRPLRDQRFEYQLVGLLKRAPDLVAEPLRAAVERVEGAEDVDSRVGVADDEHRRLVRCGRGGLASGRCGGKRGSDKQIDHPSPSRGEWHWTERSGKKGGRVQPRPIDRFTHQTPQPDTLRGWSPTA